MKPKTASRLTLHAFFLLYFSLFTIHYSLNAQQYGWTDLSANIPDHDSIFNTLRDVRFIGQEGWIAASMMDNEAKIYHTTNGGLSFDVQVFPQNSGGYCTSVFMRDNQIGYAATNTGHILYTSDGGLNWAIIGSGMGLLYSISFPPLPEPSGYTCSANGTVYKITGTDIVQDMHGAYLFHSVTCPANSEEAWVCGGNAIRHRNADGWQIGDQNYSTGNAYNAIFFTDNQNGWAVGAPHWKETQPLVNYGTIIHTVNGMDWLGQTDPDTNNLNDLFFLNIQEGWAVGNYVILHTSDAGVTWNQEGKELTDSVLLASVFAANNHEVYTVGLKKKKPVFLKYGTISGLEEQGGMGAWGQGSVEVWPNPTRGEFKVQSSECKVELQDLELLDIYGKRLEIWNPEPGTRNLELDLFLYPSGVYFLRIKIDNALIVKKIIKT